MDTPARTADDRERIRPCGTVSFASMLLLILALAAGMAIVRSRLQLVGMSRQWTNGDRAIWIAEVVESELAGIVLVVGAAMAVDGWRNPNSPVDRRWGLGRMTIAMTATWIVLQWLVQLVGFEFSNMQFQKPLGTYMLIFARRLHLIGSGMTTMGFPVCLGSAWIVWQIAGRRDGARVDLMEIVGRAIGVTIFATFIICIVIF